MKGKLQWIGVNICRLLVAVAFIFSGITKVIDPHGTEYKLQDYATALHVEHLMPSMVALILSIALAVFEFRIGFCTLFGIYRKATSRIALAFTAVFTLITLWLAIANPISDCGCFGDAVVLSNWQTFWKNIVLLLAVLVICRYHKLELRIISEGRQWIVLIFAQLFALGVALHALWKLPVVDFRPFRVGNHLPSLMQTSDDAKFVTTFLMEKDGEQRWFSLEDYPDSTWVFVDSKTEQIGEVEKPEIDNFQMFLLPEGDDITEGVLAHRGYVFLLAAPSLREANDGHMDAYNNIYDYCVAHDYLFYMLTSSSEEDIKRWMDLTGAEYPICHTDELTLKTMVRSNPGLLLLEEGTVRAKWPYTDMPELNEESPRIPETGIIEEQEAGNAKRSLRLLLWFIIPLVVVTFLDRIWWWVTILLNRRRKRRKHILQDKENVE
ncbi:MAG: DoxX family protein [Bacteroidales bacterium]|nr:DoxX family protein [Candidatus Physcousia equi]